VAVPDRFWRRRASGGLRGRRRAVHHIATGGNQLQGSSYGDAIWTFSLKGQFGSAVGSAAACDVARARRTDCSGADTIKIGDNNVEYAYGPARTRIKAGPTVTFHAMSAICLNDARGRSNTSEMELPAQLPGQRRVEDRQLHEAGIHYYICTPHPWMYGQIIVEP